MRQRKLDIAGTTIEMQLLLLVDLLPALIPTYMRNSKIICQGVVCKINKSPILSVKILKNMTPGENGKWNIFQI